MNISNLINNPQKLEELFNKVIKEKNKELAHFLLPHINNPLLFSNYAVYIIQGRVNEKLEAIIATNAIASYNYAKLVLNGPFPLGEPAISEIDFVSMWYAREVLQGPFPLGEPTLIKSQFLHTYLSNQDLIAFSKRYPHLHNHPLVRSIYRKIEWTPSS